MTIHLHGGALGLGTAAAADTSDFATAAQGALAASALQPGDLGTVVPVTTSTAPTAADSHTIYSNEGDTDGATLLLPAAAAGLQFTALVHTAQTFTITAAAGDTLRLGSSVTAAAGSITSNVVGSAVTLWAINQTEWLASAVVGSWSL